MIRLRDELRGEDPAGELGVGSDRIGLKDLWVRKRMLDHGVTGDKAEALEQGMWKGMEDFEAVVLPKA